VKPQDFIDKIFQDAEDDEFVCVSEGVPKKEEEGMWFNNMFTTSRLWSRWDPDDDPRAMYYSVCTTDGTVNDHDRARRGRAQLVRPHVLVLDDIGDKTAAPDVEPTYVLETSPGSFQWGYALVGATTEDLDTFEALCTAIHGLGYGDAGAGGSYRVVRVPGSANLKPGRGGFVSVLVEADWSVAWTLRELAEDFGLDLDDLPVPVTATRAGIADKLGGATAAEGIDPLLAWLSDAGHVVSDSGDWVDVVCPWADAHTAGSNTAGYSPLGRGEGKWVQTRAFKCLHEHCADKRFPDAVEAWQKEGAPFCAGFDPMPWLLDRYVMVAQGEQYADMTLRPRGSWLFTKGEVDMRHGVRVPVGDKSIPVSSALTLHEDARRVDVVGYRPGAGALYEQGGQPCVNAYAPPDWPETNVEPTIFLDHMEWLIPSDEEREVFLNWLAWKTQNPGRRSYAVVMIAEGFGVGRSWIKDLLWKMTQGSVNTATLGQLIGEGTSAERNYNDWMVRCQYIVVEEAKEEMDAEVFYRGYTTFKQVVDTRPQEIRVNPKYGKSRSDTTYFNTLILSNHADAMVVPEDDRRVYVVQNPAERHTPAYYESLNRALDDNRLARSLYWWLMRRDVSAYDPVYPPMTPGKMQMVTANKSPVDQIWEYLVDQWPTDLVSRGDLDAIVHMAAKACDLELGKEGAVAKRVWRKMQSLDPMNKDGLRLSIEGKQVQVRAVRNAAKWSRETGGTISLVDQVTRWKKSGVAVLMPKKM
jgi:uncharacterized protein YktA (UPF0223 family)